MEQNYFYFLNVISLKLNALDVQRCSSSSIQSTAFYTICLSFKITIYSSNYFNSQISFHPTNLSNYAWIPNNASKWPLDSFNQIRHSSWV